MGVVCMPSGQDGFFVSVWRNLRNSAALWVASLLGSVFSTIAVAVWGYARQITFPEVVWYSAVTLPITAGGFGVFAVISRRIWNALSRQISIQFDAQSNSNKEEARIVIANVSSSRPLKGLQVKIESLVPLSNEAELKAKSIQFTGLPLRIERGQQKMELGTADHVEAWVARHQPGQTYIRIYSSEKCEFTHDDTYLCDIGEYLITIVATGENVPAARRSFMMSANPDGGLSFTPCRTRPLYTW